MPPAISLSAVTGAGSSAIGERLPPRFGDLHPRDFDGTRSHRHALRCCRRQPGADQIGYLWDGEPVCEHDRFGAAVWRCGEQFERAAASRIGKTTGARALV